MLIEAKIKGKDDWQQPAIDVQRVALHFEGAHSYLHNF